MKEGWPKPFSEYFFECHHHHNFSEFYCLGNDISVTWFLLQQFFNFDFYSIIIFSLIVPLVLSQFSSWSRILLPSVMVIKTQEAKWFRQLFMTFKHSLMSWQMIGSQFAEVILQSSFLFLSNDSKIVSRLIYLLLFFSFLHWW